MSKAKQGKKVLITGGTRGVGKAVAQLLAEHSANTFFINFLENKTAAEVTKKELEATGATVFLVPGNMAYPEEIIQMFKTIKEHTDELDYFVHCPAVTTFKPLFKVKPNQWDLTMNVSARSFLQCTQACVPLMEKGGAVVAVSSNGSRGYTPNYGALGIAKSALEHTVRYLAVELANQKIRVNGITPGMLTDESTPPFPELELVIEEAIKRTPAGRLGTTNDVAEMIQFLLTKASWMYGQNVLLDGGFNLT